jgi:hypothetical protein
MQLQTREPPAMSPLHVRACAGAWYGIAHCTASRITNNTAVATDSRACTTSVYVLDRAVSTYTPYTQTHNPIHTHNQSPCALSSGPLLTAHALQPGTDYWYIGVLVYWCCWCCRHDPGCPSRMPLLRHFPPDSNTMCTAPFSSLWHPRPQATPATPAISSSTSPSSAYQARVTCQPGGDKPSSVIRTRGLQ